MTDLKCAVCLRLGDRNSLAITITNGHALCNRHFQRLNAWESPDHGGPSLTFLVDVMSTPAQPSASHDAGGAA